MDDHFFRISETFATKNVVGCTAETVICQRNELEGEPAVVLWGASLPGVNVRLMHLQFDPAVDGGIFTGWPDELAANEWSPGSFMLSVADPFSFPMDAFLQRMNNDRPKTKIVGGMASGGNSPGDCQLIMGDRIFDRGAVFAHLSGAIRLRTVVSQGCRPIGQPLVITKCERNVIHQLGGLPAMEQLEKTFKQLPSREQILMKKGLNIGRVVDEHVDDVSQGDFLIRNVIGFEEETDGLVIADFVRNGQTIQFHLRDGGTADIELQRMLSEQVRFGKNSLVGGLTFSCNGRGTRLFDAQHHDASLIQDFLGPIPVAGFFAAGEIGPVASKNFLHGFTNSIALFERP